MKKLLVCMLAFFAAAAMPLKAQDLLSKRHSLSVAFETSSYTYREPIQGHPISHKGTFNGIWAEYAFKGRAASAGPDAPFTYFLAAEGNYLSGKVAYDGWLMPLYTPYHVSGIDNYFAELRLKAGAMMQAGAIWQVQPYTGIAGRYSQDSMQKRSPYGYNRTDFYLYIPFGLKARATLPRNWALSLGGELDWFLMGKQKSRMSDIDGADFSDLTFDQSGGYGARLSARIDKSYKRFGIFIEPFYRYWNIKESEPSALYDGGVFQGLYVEPDNNTKEYGLRAGVFF